MAESPDTEYVVQFPAHGSLLGNFLSNITVESYDQRELDGKIQTYFKITSRCEDMTFYTIGPSTHPETGEMHAVIEHLANILGHDINVTVKPKDEYTVVERTADWNTPLLLSEFLTEPTPATGLQPLEVYGNEHLERYRIFDPIPKGGPNEGISMLSDSIRTIKTRLKTDEPCLCYDHDGEYGEYGILGRRINERIILPVIFNAKVETSRSIYKRLSDDDICYIKPNSEDEAINRIIQADSYWVIVRAPGECVDWHALYNYYNVVKA